MQTEPIVPASTRASFTFVQCDFQDFRLGYFEHNEWLNIIVRTFHVECIEFFFLLDVLSP